MTFTPFYIEENRFSLACSMSATLVELELLLVRLAVEEVADVEVVAAAVGGCVLSAGEPFCS